MYIKYLSILAVVSAVTIHATAVDPFQIELAFTSSTAANAVTVSFIPQNPNGWVGLNQYILMTYGALRSFDKTTNLPDSVLDS
jgi:hypothetical protein